MWCCCLLCAAGLDLASCASQSEVVVLLELLFSPIKSVQASEMILGGELCNNWVNALNLWQDNCQ